jgi:hypothetical protein
MKDTEKRFCIEIKVVDRKTGEKIERIVCANREIGAWRQVVELLLQHVSIYLLIPFLEKRCGSWNVMDAIINGKDDLIKAGE